MWEKCWKSDVIVSRNVPFRCICERKCWKSEVKVTWNEKIMLNLNEKMLHLHVFVRKNVRKVKLLLQEIKTHVKFE